MYLHEGITCLPAGQGAGMTPAVSPPPEPGGGSGSAAPDPQERDDATLHRELDELSGELRTCIPATTLLLAFLLTVPFASGFPAMDDRQRASYFVAFLSAAVALVLMLGESGYHRLRGKPYDKGVLVRTAGRQLVAALAFVGVAIAAVVFLVTDILFGPVIATGVTIPLALLVVVTWFGIPLVRRLRDDRPLLHGTRAGPSGC